jgi:hypothetical protein
MLFLLLELMDLGGANGEANSISQMIMSGILHNTTSRRAEMSWMQILILSSVFETENHSFADSGQVNLTDDSHYNYILN